MFAETGLLLPFLQGFPQELGASAGHHHLLLPLPEEEELISSFTTTLCSDAPHLANLMRSSSISEYDLGGEGDLFKAPEPIIEEPVLAVDPMTAAMSLIGGNDIVAETIKAVEMESIQNENLLSEVFYNCKNELLAKSAIEDSSSELSDVKLPTRQSEDEPAAHNIRSVVEGPIQKSVSAGCLSSMDWINGCTMRPNFLEFQEVDFGAAFGMRRAHSEGDIQTLRTSNSSLGITSMVHTSLEQQLAISDFQSEERRQKLSRYRKKKTKRNFGRKIKYACRKALADSQPRVRGRFAKTEECDIPKPHKLL